ncbi:MAG: hypothetical protein V1898_02125 [Patescibacteria group bacterium]
MKKYFYHFITLLLVNYLLIVSKVYGGVFFEPGDATNQIIQAPVASSSNFFTLGTASPLKFTFVIINYITTFLGFGLLILIIYAGFLWMTARGNEEQITKATDIIKRALIGLAIVLLSMSIAWVFYYLITTSIADLSTAVGP